MNSLSQLWQYAATHKMLLLAVVGLVLIFATGVVCLVYGFRLQRMLRGKRRSGSKEEGAERC